MTPRHQEGQHTHEVSTLHPMSLLWRGRVHGKSHSMCGVLPTLFYIGPVASFYWMHFLSCLRFSPRTSVSWGNWQRIGIPRSEN